MTNEFDRRLFLGAAAGATAMLGSAQAAEPTATKKNIVYTPKPLAFDPKTIKGLSEKILVSHYENNYIGAVKRLNAIAEKLAALDFDKAAGFEINGLKREELIATNSMILHEIYFAGLGEANAPGAALAARSRVTSAPSIVGVRNSSGLARRSAAARAGLFSPTTGVESNSSTPGRAITLRSSLVANRCSSSTCTSIPITWTTAPGLGTM